MPEMMPETTPETGQEAAGSRNIDPKQVDAVQKVVLAAMKLVFDPEVSKGLVQMMSKGPPQMTVAVAAKSILTQLAQAGTPPELVAMVMPVVVSFVIQIGVAAKVFPRDPKLGQQVMMLLTQKRAQQEPAQATMDQGAMQGGMIQQAMGAQ